MALLYNLSLAHNFFCMMVLEEMTCPSHACDLIPGGYGATHGVSDEAQSHIIVHQNHYQREAVALPAAG
jgi:hypothetical protein